MSNLSSFFRQPVLVFLAVVLGLAFTVYCSYRQKYIGGTDWYGYYQEAQLLKQGRVLLPIELPIDAYPAAVPMGYMPVEDRAVPQYPPGYPVLLAVAGILNLEYFVTPLCGLLGCLLMFLVVRDLTEPWTAAVYALLWAFSPSSPTAAPW
jgi:asparagine N-glycosylation enzyme membrane subunit Stt3